MHDEIHNLEPESPFLLERLMRLTRRRVEETEFESEEDFRKEMADLVADGLQDEHLEVLKDDPLELAQELAFQAYESSAEGGALELAEEALTHDPECVDALAIKAFLSAQDAGQLISDLEHALTCGERRLGEDFFAEFMGDFWPMVEARPYMRCIKQLAEVMWTVGRRFDAVAHYENLLDLDPSDHMGNSPLLLGYYLSMGEVQRSWDLLEEFDDEVSAVANWGWVLIYLMIGDEEGAHGALDHALDANPYVAPLFLGLGQDLDKDMPPVIVPGSEAEAQYCAHVLGDAFERSPEAQIWLYNVLVDLGLIGEEEEDPEAGRVPPN